MSLIQPLLRNLMKCVVRYTVCRLIDSTAPESTWKVIWTFFLLFGFVVFVNCQQSNFYITCLNTHFPISLICPEFTYTWCISGSVTREPLSFLKLCVCVFFRLSGPKNTFCGQYKIQYTYPDYCIETITVTLPPYLLPHMYIIKLAPFLQVRKDETVWRTLFSILFIFALQFLYKNATTAKNIVISLEFRQLNRLYFYLI